MITPRHPFIALTAAVLLMFALGTAQGATISVFSGDLAAWNAAAGTPVTVEDFADSMTPGLSITFGSDLPGSISGGVYHDRAKNEEGTKPTFTFTPPIRAFGANWNLFVPTGPGTQIKLHLTFSDSPGMDVPTEIPNTFTGQFFGIVSDTAIVSIRFDEGTSATGEVETFDMDDARFVPFDSSVITTVAMNLNFPFGVAVDNGDVYIADRNSHIVWRLSGETRTAVAGTGEAGYNGDGIPATTAQLNSPTGVAVANGNLFIADSGSHIVRKVNLSTGEISTVAGTPQKNGLAVNGGLATQALLFGPRGVATDAEGNIYIADTMNQQVRKVDAITGSIAAVAGVAGETGNNDGSFTSARLNSPLGVAVGTTGSVYIADEGNDNIRKVSDGFVSTLLSPGTLDSPSGVAVAADGTLYIADTDNHRIQRVVFGEGLTIITVAGNGTEGDSGDGGPATAAQLNSPIAVAVDSTGDILYIADLINQKIRKVNFTP